MKLTKSRLRQIIKEELLKENQLQFAPTAAEEAIKVNSQIPGMMLQTDQDHWEKYGIVTGEDLALSLLGSTYSDMYKSLHGIRPRWQKFNTPAEAQDAISDLEHVYEDMLAQEEIDVQQQAEYEKKEAEIQSLMPGEFDFEHVPRRSGMGRRLKENAMKLTKKQLKQIILEELSLVLKEGVVIPGPWEGSESSEEEELPEEFQYEYVLDELVNAARDAIMPLAVEKLKKVGGYGGEEEGGMIGALTYNDIELEIEEPLLDALKPLAKLIQTKTDGAIADDDDDLGDDY